ncbi:hypothetical protein H5410_023279 [Solanum commersonii]|uniref:Uncharacterized protein n=1 Tax=Solanum commersonii TaxID=4109 RepID=A0A9J5ZK02_SOLCO|nr:hypothetical protein H5410_023279 [Solanum commersonii]
MFNDEFNGMKMNISNDEIGHDVEEDQTPTPIVDIVGKHITSHNSHATTKVLGKYFKNTFLNGKGPSTRDMANQLRTKLSCKVSYWKIYKGREIAKSLFVSHFYNAAKAYNTVEFYDHFNQIRDMVPKARQRTSRISSIS